MREIPRILSQENVRRNVLPTSSQDSASGAQVKTVTYYQELIIDYMHPVRNRNRKARGRHKLNPVKMRYLCYSSARWKFTPMQDFVNRLAPLHVRAIFSAMVSSFIFSSCSHVWVLVIRSGFISTPCGELFNATVRANNPWNVLIL